jgi:Na+-transporting methylmalonyl-CoA/oxaloacetate decarboxylase gamma subunit
MDDSLTVALLVTVMGMGLVFGAILLMAVLTGLLARVTSTPTRIKSDKIAEDPADRDLKLQAAAVAVAVALAQQTSRKTPRPQPFPVPPTALVSTWQAVMRARQIGERRTVR